MTAWTTLGWLDEAPDWRNEPYEPDHVIVHPGLHERLRRWPPRPPSAFTDIKPPLSIRHSWHLTCTSAASAP